MGETKQGPRGEIIGIDGEEPVTPWPDRLAAIDLPAFVCGVPVLLARQPSGSVVALTQRQARRLAREGRLIGWTPDA